MVEGRVDTATVVFTDLVGSTELRARLGEDRAEVVRSIHDGLVDHAISSHRGVLVKHLGDGVMATFTSAEAAVSAAVAVQQAIDGANRRGELDDMAVRIGISVGDVTFEGEDCFGLPVIEAQRLESSAAPGTIRCAELVMQLARGRGDHDFVDLGEIELKGLPEPLRSCEVLWSPIIAASSPLDSDLPPVLARGGGLPFAGRHDTFDELQTAWKRAAVGGFEVVLLAGEPGVGKTRLAHELARAIGDDAVVLAGRCDEDVQAPFRPFAMALDWCLEHPSGPDPTASLGRYPGDLVRLVPDLGDRVPGLAAPLDADPEAQRIRLFQATASWLSQEAAGRPVLLVIDDLHWADKPSLLLLRHLLVEQPEGLMVLCTYRDTDVDRVHPLSAMLADLRRSEAVTRLSLDGLDPDGVRELLVRTGGHDLDDNGLAFAELVHRETAGNPFFMGEVLRHLAETGVLVEENGRWVSEHSPDEEAVIPEGIREVVGRRVGRLGDDVEQVLRAAAVIGHDFDVDLLVAVTALPEDDVLDALDLAVAANLVGEAEVGRYRFAHALVRETLHSELSSTRRARQHRKVAEALEAAHHDDPAPVIEDLATHWIEASVGGDPTRAIELATAAGKVSVGRGAHEHAVGWYERALELIDDDPALAAEGRRAMADLAAAEVFAEGRDHGPTARRAARAAIEAADREAAYDALMISARESFDEGQPADPDRVALLREGLAVFADLPAAQRAGLLGELATELIYERDLDGRAAALAEIEELLPALSDRDRGRLMATVFISVMEREDRDSIMRRLGHLEAALAVETDASWRARLLGTAGFCHLSLGDSSGAYRSLDRWRAAVEERGASDRDHLVAMAESMLAAMRGDLDEADEAADRLVGALRRQSRPEAVTFRATSALAIGRERGDTSWLTEGWRMTAETEHPSSAANAGTAFLLMLDGDLDAATCALDRAALAEIPNDGSWPLTVGCWAEVAARSGSSADVEALHDLLLAKSGLFLMTGGISLGPTDRLLALLRERLGDPDGADAYFDAAIELSDGFGSPPWTARSQLDRAEVQLSRGEVDRARTSLDAADEDIGDLPLVASRNRLVELRQQADA